MIYVTERFAECVTNNNLQGFLLMKIWPLEAAVNWFKEGLNQARLRRTESAKQGLWPRCHRRI